MLIFSAPDQVSPPQTFPHFVESPIEFVGRDNQGGLENARATSFEKKLAGKAENTTRILLFRGLYTVRILTKNICEAEEE